MKDIFRILLISLFSLIIISCAEKEESTTTDDTPANTSSDESSTTTAGYTRENLPDETKNVISMPLKNARRIFERNYLQSQIQRFNGNISKTASFIGMERSALHRKLKQLGLNEEEERK